MRTSYVVVPTYNERENVKQLVEALISLQVRALRVLIVDDSSPDGTGDLADQLALSYPGRVEVLHRPEKQGLASAYRAGMQCALQRGASYLVQMDADFSHPPELVPVMLSGLSHSDVVIGSRYIRWGGLHPAWPLTRKALSRAANKYVRFALGLPVSDITSGFAAYRAGVFTKLDLSTLESRGFLFQAEVKYACHKLGFQMHELPFVFMNRKAGKSKIGLSIVLEALWKVWKIRNRPLMRAQGTPSPSHIPHQSL